LYSTRMTVLLHPKGFTLSQFALLNHLVRSNKKTHSINELTEAMEINQPGVTKIVQKLHEADLVKVSISKDDSRKREVSLTERGREKVVEVGLEILPDVEGWFQDWKKQEVEQFMGYLGRLAYWLDKNRLQPRD
jgi:DNA-binding MarR family transcriptional regulator